MKQTEVLKVLALEFGSSDPIELNRILKAKVDEQIKFKLMGESLGYLGLKVAIKNITPEGLKVFDINRVRLIRFSELETFEKAKPKVARPTYDKPKPKPARVIEGIKAAKARKAGKPRPKPETSQFFKASPSKARKD